MEENLNSFIDNQERAKRVTTSYFDPAFPLSGSNTKLEHTYDSEAFSSGMSDYLDQHFWMKYHRPKP